MIRFTFTPTVDTLYTVEDVGGDNDRSDWLKLGGTMTLGNVFKKSRETLAAWRLMREEPEDVWFEGAIYKRSEESGGKHEATFVDSCILDPFNGFSNSSLTIEIPREFALIAGAWLGGDGKIVPSNGKFVGYYLNIEKVQYIAPR